MGITKNRIRDTAVKERAVRDRVSVNPFSAGAAAANMAGVTTLDDRRAAAARGRRGAFPAMLDRAPDAPPLPGDERA
jgi:hypothetical protein